MYKNSFRAFFSPEQTTIPIETNENSYRPSTLNKQHSCDAVRYGTIRYP